MAVVLDLEAYELLVDRAAFVRALEEGDEAARSGDVASHEEAVRLLDTFGR